ncbi:hypothetical protein PACILC2_34990 [Paenibacillus cisolokensis]|uniref:Uncharacterized protein n=1 Tax=Paenibacillus cisolokensis TaxID=1658519 RepID=A0ABQ4N9S8_9BACL|nr:hypothetical protein [Paenibacillus cisolokensis]GIQ64931.1 hypothetical protein PACILC2_34990 [Paenibacillus cisolokensis]
MYDVFIFTLIIVLIFMIREFHGFHSISFKCSAKVDFVKNEKMKSDSLSSANKN